MDPLHQPSCPLPRFVLDATVRPCATLPVGFRRPSFYDLHSRLSSELTDVSEAVLWSLTRLHSDENASVRLGAAADK